MPKKATHHGSRAVAEAGGVRFSATGHPSVKQLMAEQGTGPIKDVSLLRGDFWPEEEPIEQFLEALHEWRGHKRTQNPQ